MWGWEPTVEFLYEDGRLVGSVAEPEFDEDQLALVRGLYDYEASLNSLGIPLDEATAAEADRDNRDGAYFYEAEGVLDHSLLAEARYRASLPENDPNREGRLVRVRRVERGPRGTRSA